MDPALPIDLMDSALYQALVEGNEDVDDALWQKMEQLGGRQVTPKGSTILHIVALYGYIHFLQKILEQHSYAPSLLCARNKKNQTALHIAANEGHTDVVSALISYAKTHPELEPGIGATDMVRMTDDDKDTALHKAVRKGHLEVVKLLVREDPEFEFPANEAGETPLYLAAELRYHKCLLEIINNCKRPVYGGPLGRTALHAAVINAELYRPSDCTKLLLEKEASLCEVGDDWGWTPLHCAVKLHNKRAVSDILGVNSSAAYIPAGKDGEWTTAIHIAVSVNSVVMFEQILERCPLCWEMVNSKGQNVLHEAVLGNSKEIIKYILNKSPKRDHLIEEKDEDGNTPLHLYASFDTSLPELNQHLRLKGDVVFNKRHLTPEEIIIVAAHHQGVGKRGDLTKKTNDNGGKKQMIQEKEEKSISKEEIAAKERATGEAEIAKTHIVVATLIATVTFAAGITLPGGYDNSVGETKQGTAILIRKSAFRAFVVTDVIGFLCSIASLFGNILVVEAISTDWGTWGGAWGLKLAGRLDSYAVTMLTVSLTAVVLAFITGMFAVLTIHSSAVAIAVCVGVSLSAFLVISFPFFFGMGMILRRKRRDKKTL